MTADPTRLAELTEALGQVLARALPLTVFDDEQNEVRVDAADIALALLPLLPARTVSAADPRLAELTEALERVQPWLDGQPTPWHWWGEHIEPDGARITGHRRGSSRQFALALLPARTATTEAEALAALVIDYEAASMRAVERGFNSDEGSMAAWRTLIEAARAALAATGGEK